MNPEAIAFYAEKFFPHLRRDYAILCIQAIIDEMETPDRFQEQSQAHG